MSDLKPGFYYVRFKSQDSDWTVGKCDPLPEGSPLRERTRHCWGVVGSGYFLEDSQLEIGAYLDPQPGEPKKPATKWPTASLVSFAAYEEFATKTGPTDAEAKASEEMRRKWYGGG